MSLVAVDFLFVFVRFCTPSISLLICPPSTFSSCQVFAAETWLTSSLMWSNALRLHFHLQRPCMDLTRKSVVQITIYLYRPTSKKPPRLSCLLTCCFFSFMFGLGICVSGWAGDASATTEDEVSWICMRCISDRIDKSLHSGCFV